MLEGPFAGNVARKIKTCYKPESVKKQPQGRPRGKYQGQERVEIIAKLAADPWTSVDIAEELGHHETHDHRAKVRVRGGENSAQYGHNQALVTQL